MDLFTDTGPVAQMHGIYNTKSYTLKYFSEVCAARTRPKAHIIKL